MTPMRSALLTLALIAACGSAPRDKDAPLPGEIKKQEESLAVDRKTLKPTDRSTYTVSEADARDFNVIWELFRNRSPDWPRQRDRFVKRGPGAGYLVAGHLLRYYMQANLRRERAQRDFIRARNEIIALGAPCVPALVDLMILDSIKLPEGERYYTDDITRRDCIHMLGEIGEPSVDQLFVVLKRKDLGPKGRRFVALALGETRSPRAYDTLVRLLRTDSSWQVRADAAEALGTLGDRRAIAPLSEAVLKDDDVAVIKRAGRARYRLQGRVQ